MRCRGQPTRPAASRKRMSNCFAISSQHLSPFSKRRRDVGSTASFLPPMLGAIRGRRSWRAPFSEDVRHLKAAMLLADLRGFSRLTDELPEERIVELLNAFFDLVVPGVIAGGGD